MARRQQEELDHVANTIRVFLTAASCHAERAYKLPGEAPLVAALATVVNLLASKQGADQTVALLEDLTSPLRRGERVEHGWVLHHLQQSKRRSSRARARQTRQTRAQRLTQSPLPEEVGEPPINP